jgi:hypothetical protein
MRTQGDAGTVALSPVGTLYSTIVSSCPLKMFMLDIVRRTYKLENMAEIERREIAQVIAWALRQGVSLQKGYHINCIRTVVVDRKSTPQFVWVYFDGIKEPMELKLHGGALH